jgi:hypothetical protein
MPKPPMHYPFHREIYVDDEAMLAPKPSNVFDPSSFTDFGELPTQRVLVYLMRCTGQLLEYQMKSCFASVDQIQRRFVPGGVGSSIFLGGNEKDSKRVGVGMGAHHRAMSFQLLATSLVIFTQKRNEAARHYHRSVNRLDEATQRSVGAASNEAEAPDCQTPQSNEEDDPALTFAIACSDSPTSGGNELEAKGMARKAGAAARDSLALMESLSKATRSCQERLRLYSYCVLYAQRCLRMYCRGVTEHFLSLSSIFPTNLSVTVESLRSACSPQLLQRLEHCLTGFMAPGFRMREHSPRDEELTVVLYRDALFLWAEMLPLLFGAETVLIDKFRDIMGMASKASERDMSGSSIDAINSFPGSEYEVAGHQLQLICRRLRVADVVPSFVSSPVTFSPGNEYLTPDEILRLERPRLPSFVVSLLLTSLPSLTRWRKDLEHLMLSIGHTCHKLVFLYGEVDVESKRATAIESSAALATGKTLSSGEIRIHTQPSADFEFDCTKCSDSISILTSSGTNVSGVPGPSVLQRASKVWGSVLSSTYFEPKTGIHRWAVKLDRCERGHVFVGVATSQAGMRSYVGSDKHGWGMIGTQALWHERRKVSARK